MTDIQIHPVGGQSVGDILLVGGFPKLTHRDPLLPSEHYPCRSNRGAGIGPLDRERGKSRVEKHDIPAVDKRVGHLTADRLRHGGDQCDEHGGDP